MGQAYDSGLSGVVSPDGLLMGGAVLLLGLG